MSDRSAEWDQRRILVIDDNPAIHGDFLKILRPPTALEVELDECERSLFGGEEVAAFEVDTALQGREGVEMVREARKAGRPYALAFVDMRMPPGWDGIETVRRLWEADADVQVVFCTAFSDRSLQEIRETLSPGDRMLILKKPFDSIEVLQLAHALTEKWRLLQESRDRLGGLERMVSRRTRELVESERAAIFLRDAAVEERERSERALRELRRETEERARLEAKFREQASLLDKARDAIVVRDLEQRVTYWNKSAERLFGWTAAEAVGRRFQELIPQDVAAYDGACAELMIAGEWAGEQTLETRTGELIVADARWTLVRNESDEPTGVLAIHTDVTRHKELERQFYRAQRLESIGTLAGGIAHDLNNVFGPIMMGIELLEMGLTDQRSAELLSAVTASARRGADMVNQVLSFARGTESKRSEMSVTELLDDVSRFVRETFPKNIVVESVVAPGLRAIEGDPTQLHQVLVNLAVNARDAMPAGGRLRMAAEQVESDALTIALPLDVRPGPYLRLTVEDTGPGIPTEHLERIFDPFFTTKKVGQGTGLGLSTSLSILKSHGGFIDVRNLPGGGARFTIHLPAMIGSGSSPSSPEPVARPRGNGQMILVVDDEEPVREMARRVLEGFGYRVMMAANGEEACRCYEARQAEIDLVLTDMMMPGMDGAATIREITGKHPAARIVATSGLDIHRDVCRADGRRVDHFLPKPYNAEILLTTLHRALTL